MGLDCAGRAAGPMENDRPMLTPMSEAPAAEAHDSIAGYRPLKWRPPGPALHAHE